MQWTSRSTTGECRAARTPSASPGGASPSMRERGGSASGAQNWPLLRRTDARNAAGPALAALRRSDSDLPRPAFEDVIDGVAMDLDDDAIRRPFRDLFEYCRRVASAVGLICIRIFGCQRTARRDIALNLGVALQLTNILRDVKDDLARGRVYLPLEDLAACGCTVDDLAAGAMTDPVGAACEFECAARGEFYRRAR